MAKKSADIQKTFKPFGGFSRGESSRTSHMIPAAYAKQLLEFRFVPNGCRTRLGWNTISQGLDSGSYPGSASGGWNSGTYGRFVDYANSDSGKVMVFNGGAICDTATTAKFATATSSDISLPGGEAAFLGVVWFADKFLIYTALALYELTIATGALTSVATWATDLPADYYPVKKIIVRFGQLWIMTDSDRIFWSTVNEYTVASGSQVEDQALPTVFGEWINVYNNGKLSSIDEVEFFNQNTLRVNSLNRDNNTTGGYAIAGQTFAIVSKFDFDKQLVDTDEVIALDMFSNAQQENVVDSHALHEETLAANAPSGQSYIDILGSTKSAAGFRRGESVIVSGAGEGPDSLLVDRVTQSGNYTRIFFASSLTDDYTTGNGAKIQSQDFYKAVFTDEWENTLVADDNAHAPIRKNGWTAIPTNLYETSLDPANDDNATGHIKITKAGVLANASGQMRITYTPVDNSYQKGSSGFLDINRSRGNNITLVEGPNKNEEEGASLLYLFKDSGDIHAITGKPGVGGGPGTLDVKLIATGIKGRVGSVQTTKDGIYFGEIDGADYKYRFMPHLKYVTSEEMPIISDEFLFDITLPFDDSTYEFYETSEVIHGDQIVIHLPYSTGGALPSGNGKNYIGNAYFENNNFRGRWTTISDNIESIVETEESITIADSPVTTGFYRHNGELYKVYYVKTGHDFAGATRYYEIASYGYRDGGEECKDRYVYTREEAGPSYVTAFYEDFFQPEFRSGMMKFGDKISVHRFFFGIDNVGGSVGDGIDIEWQIYKDLDTATGIFLTAGVPTNKTVSDVTDDSSGLNLMTEKDVDFEARFMQLYMKWDNIKYNDHPAYVLLRDIIAEISQLSNTGVTTEEDN
jgi:hypothetical protein